MTEDNKELWTREAEMDLSICADFLARMILKYGDTVLHEIEIEKNKTKSDE